MVISGNEIRQRKIQGIITIDPYSEEQINPHSYDVRLKLGGAYVIKAKSLRTPIDPKNLNSYLSASNSLPENATAYCLQKGDLLIASTKEVIGTDKFAPTLWGKSSLGRLGVLVHFTAGYIDAGFKGSITLEISGQFDTIFYDNMKIAQVQFNEIYGTVDLYKGKYSNNPKGAELSKI